MKTNFFRQLIKALKERKEKLERFLFLSLPVQVHYFFYPAYVRAAWNPKSLVEGVIDFISYILAIAWAVVLTANGLQRKYARFTVIFIFGGMGLAMLNSSTREYAVSVLGKAWQAILNARG